MITRQVLVVLVLLLPTRSIQLYLPERNLSPTHAELVAVEARFKRCSLIFASCYVSTALASQKSADVFADFFG